jgi:phage terminase large subunit-like protein
MQRSALLPACHGLSRAQILAALESLTNQEAEAILYDWPTWARPEQLLPGGDWWRNWLILAGRGWGKTRTGGETIRALIDQGYGRIALIGQTAADVRDVIVEGESGILASSPPWARPTYEPSKRRLTWPSGAIATTYSGDEPDQLRGPQHDAALCDELAKWKYPQDAWDNLQMGLRLGQRPLAAVTTTPRPLPIIKAIAADPQTVVTRGSTYDNAANLPQSTLDYLKRKYEGSRLGRQELYAEILDDAPGALWKREQIDADRVTEIPGLQRTIVSVDPSATGGENSDECGIVAAALGEDGAGYLLEDRSVRAMPDEWAKEAVALYHKLGANLIVAEANQGGEMVRQVLKAVDRNVPVKLVHASKSKQARAEPISVMAEQHRIHHVGNFGALEDELCQWVPGTGQASPNRLDAYVWAFTDLMIDGKGDIEFV